MRSSIFALAALLATSAAAHAQEPAQEPAPTVNASPSSSPTLIYACYVPSTGNVYRIKSAGLPANCEGPRAGPNRHVEFSWNAEGPAGPQGEPGPQGPAGQAGEAGGAGAIGPQGPAGADGAPGPQGPAGADGAPGPQGPAGADGAAGPQGPAGADGAAGPAGPQGEPGPTGEPGPQGDKGDQGDPGAPGQDGPMGPMGPQGLPGPPGAQGPVAQAPSGAAQISTTIGFVAPGGGSGAIPASGPGIRTMWYGRKAAFRAGSVTGGQWEDHNIGQGSMALGTNVVAKGQNSVAMGQGSEATGDDATAIGDFAEASGRKSSAFGVNAHASAIFSMALGNHVSTDKANSVVVGAGYGSANPATEQDQFAVRASGGIRLRSSADLSKGCDIDKLEGAIHCTGGLRLNDGYLIRGEYHLRLLHAVRAINTVTSGLLNTVGTITDLVSGRYIIEAPLTVVKEGGVAAPAGSCRIGGIGTTATSTESRMTFNVDSTHGVAMAYVSAPDGGGINVVCTNNITSATARVTGYIKVTPVR